MARYTYDVNDILEGATTQSPFLLVLPSGGRQLVAALVSEGEWRSKWTKDGLPLDDGEWDQIDEIVAGIYRGIEDGENMDELSQAIIYLADNLQVTHDGNQGGGAGCCYDPIAESESIITGGGHGITTEHIESFGEVVPGTFTDTGSNWPGPFVDRDEYDAAKCAASNQLYRDFRTTLGGLQVLDAAIIVGSAYLLGSSLFGAGGAFVGVIALAPAAPVVALTTLVFMLSFALLFVNIGIRLKAIADRLDRETFVCAAFEATTYEELKTALLDMVQDAHDLAITEGAFLFNELFEGKLLELVAVLVPNELLETVLVGAAIVVDIIVELPEDIDCATCGAPVQQEQFTITDFGTIAGQTLPQQGWYQSHGTGTIRVEVGEDWVEPTNCCSARAAHDVTFGSAGEVDVFYDRYGAATSVNVSFYIDRWDGMDWVNEHTTPQKVGTGTTSEELLAFPVTADLYRFSWRLHNSGDTVRMANPSCLFTAD